MIYDRFGFITHIIHVLCCAVSGHWTLWIACICINKWMLGIAFKCQMEETIIICFVSHLVCVLGISQLHKSNKNHCLNCTSVFYLKTGDNAHAKSEAYCERSKTNKIGFYSFTSLFTSSQKQSRKMVPYRHIFLATNANK